jgi:murein biosynthesis integral membrane protein MurJ
VHQMRTPVEVFDQLDPRSTSNGRLEAARLRSANKQIVRALLSLASAALLIRVMGMVGQIFITARFGAGAVMDAYFVASALPLLVATLATTAIESAVIPVYAHLRSRATIEHTSAVFSTLLNLVLVIGAAVTLLLFIFRRQAVFVSAPALDPLRKELAVDLTPVIIPALLLMLGVALIEAILNAEGQFGWPAYAGLLVPASVTIAVVVLGEALGVAALAVGTLVGLGLQGSLFLLRVHRAGLIYRPIIALGDPAIGRVSRAVWPILLGASIGQASPFVDQIFASFLSPGSIAALNYSLKLIGVPVGVIFAAVGRAALPYLSRQVAIRDLRAFKATLRLSLWAGGICAVVITLLFLVLAQFIVYVLFQRGAFSAQDGVHTASTLRGFAIGLVPMALGFILARAFSALGRNRVLMYVSAFSVVANALFDYIFARLWQSFGIALATSAVYTCTLLLLILMLRRQIGDLELLTPPPEIARAVRKAFRSIKRE